MLAVHLAVTGTLLWRFVQRSSLDVHNRALSCADSELASRTSMERAHRSSCGRSPSPGKADAPAGGFNLPQRQL